MYAKHYNIYFYLLHLSQIYMYPVIKILVFIDLVIIQTVQTEQFASIVCKTYIPNLCSPTNVERKIKYPRVFHCWWNNWKVQKLTHDCFCIVCDQLSSTS